MKLQELQYEPVNKQLHFYSIVRSSLDARESFSKTYHSVLLPVSLAVWYSGKVGTTVGSGVCDADEVVVDMTLAMASTGSTIMMAMRLLCRSVDGSTGFKSERKM